MADKPLSKTKRSGGPKTAAGKEVTSRNAIKHGVFATTPVSVAEEAAMLTRMAELTAHYRPQSPLEQLQIQRIARCSVKLDSLYAIEQARAELVLLKVQSSQDKVMAHFDQHPEAAKILAKRILNNENPILPLNLTPVQLKTICQEIDGYMGVMESPEHLEAGFPHLIKFLKKTKLQGYDGPYTADHWLFATASLIQTFMMTLLSSMPIGTDKETTGIEEILRRIQTSELTNKNISSGSRPMSPGKTYQLLVREDFHAYRELNQCFEQAEEIVAQFPRIQQLLAQSTMIPTEESDKFMRYQTTLEKQLSRYIGELLELQKSQPIQAQLSN